MKLFRFNLENTPSIVAIRSDGSAAFMGGDMLELIREGLPAARQRLADATLFKHSGTMPFAEMTPLTPLPNPGKIIAVGQNYMDHIREQKGTPPKYPLLFSKFVSSIINPGDTIRWSPALTNEVDFEAELVVIIGKTARYVSEESALD